MKKPRQTKQNQIDELLIIVNKKDEEIQHQKAAINNKSGAISEWQDNDKSRRIEFAKAFNWTKKDNYSTPEYREPTWSEIFVQLGKLLTRIDVANLQKSIDNVKETTNEISERVWKIESCTAQP